MRSISSSRVVELKEIDLFSNSSIKIIKKEARITAYSRL